MQKIDAKKLRKADLLKLPSRKWDEVKTYDHLLLVPTGKKHDSGYMLIAIVGVIDEEAEIAAYCDDICWEFPKEYPYDRMNKQYHGMMMRTDCFFPSGIIRVWGSGEAYFRGRFQVGCSLSSTTVRLQVCPRGEGRNSVTEYTVNEPTDSCI